MSNSWFPFYPLFKVQDCHVIKYLPKEEYDGHTAALVVGGKNASPFCVRIIHDLKKKKRIKGTELGRFRV